MQCFANSGGGANASPLVARLNIYTGVHGRRKNFLRRHEWIFPNVFLKGAKSVEICFFPFETKKTTYLQKFSKSTGSLAPTFDAHDSVTTFCCTTYEPGA